MPELLIITPCHSLGGGVESLIDELTAYLPGRGWAVKTGLCKGHRFNDPAAYRAAHPDLDALDIDGSSGYRADRLSALQGLIEEQAPDAVLNFRVFDAYEAAARMKMNGMNVRLLTSVRGISPRMIEDVKRYRAFIDGASGASRLVTALLEEHGGMPGDRLDMLPTGIRPREQGAAERGFPLKAAYVGRLETGEKHCLDLVHLQRELDEQDAPVELHVYGDGPERETLQAAMPRAVFHGWTDTDTLYRDGYPMLDAVLLFSPAEGNPIAPREGMVHGAVPVISRYRGCLREGLFVHEENALLFEPGDTAACAGQLLRLAGDVELRARLSGAGQNMDAIYFREGAMAGWADHLDRVMHLEPRCGEVLPDVPAPRGRLDRLGMSGLRKKLKPVFPHAESGGEWPHGGPWPQAVLNRVLEKACELDQA